jgi:predicted flap endonuclease-1-like 5' DNA nuclease
MLRQRGRSLAAHSFLEESVAWLVAQSLPVILATFILGLVVGWLWWGRARRRVPFGESAAVREVSRRYEAAVAEREARIARLEHALDADPGAAHSVVPAEETDRAAGSGTAAASSTADAVPSTDATDAADASADTDRGDPASHGSGHTEPTGDDDAGPESEQPGPDDLERIEGVGPRIATALIGAGLDTFRAVAAADPEQLTAALREAGLAYAPSLVSWPIQARLLAAGDEEGLAALQTEITAGRGRPFRPAAALPDAASPPPAGGGEAPDEDLPTGDEAPEAQQAPIQQPDEDPEEDELERVEGIGPRIATALRKAGISTYRQLAGADGPTLQAALAASGLRFTPSLPTWPRQAELLAEGDEIGFLALTRTLVPDREGGRPS